MNPLVLIVSIITIACSHNGNDRSSISKDNIVAESSSISTLDTVQIINEIKKQYAEINSKAAQYDKVEKEVYDESTEGAVLIGYYEKKELKKITGIYFRETGKTVAEYYFNGNDFFFVYLKEFNYEKPIYIESSCKVKSIEESRYYFYKGELIKWISGNKTISASSKEFLERNIFFKEDFEKYKKLFVCRQNKVN